MPDDQPDQEPDIQNKPAPLRSDEIELRRYEARMSFLKVFWGTAIVGLAAVLIPGVINFSTLILNNQRKIDELDASKQTAHQQYIKDFFATAVNQDIELRIRFSDYFEHLSEGKEKELWANYLSDLIKKKEEYRDRIIFVENDLDKARGIDDATIQYHKLLIERDWSYAEIGYVPIDSGASNVPVQKKAKLYKEAVEVVSRLVNGPIDPKSFDYSHFWQLWKDLIGVESQEFASKMVAIGKILETLPATQPSQPSDEIRKLADELASLSNAELGTGPAN